MSINNKSQKSNKDEHSGKTAKIIEVQPCVYK